MQRPAALPALRRRLLLVNLIPPFGERPKMLVTRCADCDRPELLRAEPKKVWSSND
jgi:hypothetical protein